jgi:hypothetical protein
MSKADRGRGFFWLFFQVVERLAGRGMWDAGKGNI